MNHTCRKGYLRYRILRVNRILVAIVPQLMTSLAIVILLSLSASADECKSRLAGITAYFYSHGDEWSLSWDTSGVHKKDISFSDNYVKGIRTNKHESPGHPRAVNLPQKLFAPARQLNAPFDFSQKKALLLAAVYENKTFGTDYPSTQLAIIDLKKQGIVRTIDSEYKVESLAWSPDDNRFAVLGYQIVTDHVFKGPIDWLASLAGHPISYYTFYITLYEPYGTALCTERVAKKLPDAESYIDWGKKLSPRYKQVINETDSAWVKYVKQECINLGGKFGISAFDARNHKVPLERSIALYKKDVEKADPYTKEFANSVSIKIYEGVYTNMDIMTFEESSQEGTKLCTNAWLAFDPTGEKHATSVKSQKH